MITDEMVGTVAHLMTGLYGATCCHKTGGHGGQHMVEGCECRATARAALEAVLPMIRAAALEEAARVANDVREKWHNKVKEREREYLETLPCNYALFAAAEITKAIRALKERT